MHARFVKTVKLCQESHCKSLAIQWLRIIFVEISFQHRLSDFDKIKDLLYCCRHVYLAL